MANMHFQHFGPSIQNACRRPLEVEFSLLVAKEVTFASTSGEGLATSTLRRSTSKFTRPSFALGAQRAFTALHYTWS